MEFGKNMICVAGNLKQIPGIVKDQKQTLLWNRWHRCRAVTRRSGQHLRMFQHRPIRCTSTM